MRNACLILGILASLINRAPVAAEPPTGNEPLSFRKNVEWRRQHKLELLGTPDALNLLRELVRGPAGATLTEDSKAAQGRLGL